MYSDDSGEVAFACRVEAIPHDTNRPYNKQGNGIAEHMMQEVKLGTASNLEQAGLPHCYWVYAMKHFHMMWNIPAKHDLLAP